MNVLPDILTPGLAIVFCGSAVGKASALRGTYYAGPGNAFWPTLAEVGLTPRQLAPEEYRSLTKYGLGLTGLAKAVSGSDHMLTEEHFDSNGLRTKVLCYRPRILAFTSKRASEEFIRHPVDYGLMRETIGERAATVLMFSSMARSTLA